MADRMPNVLLVTVDCLRYDRCGFAGHHKETTPTLDSLAGDSLLFDQAYATGTYTTESVPGMIAGLHSHNGIYFGDDPAWKAIPADHATLATHFHSIGYDTTAVLTNPHLTSERNFDSGFDEFENLSLAGGIDRAAASRSSQPDSPIDRTRSVLSRCGVLDSVPVITAGRAYQYLSEWPSIQAPMVLDVLFDSLEAVDSPFFAWTHLMDLHRPLHPDAAGSDGGGHSPSLGRQFQIDAHAATDRFDPRFEALYDNALRYVDNRIDEIIEWLRHENQWKDTVLIITGDHGEALFDRGRYGHPRHYPYDELLHVPLLIRDPKGGARRLSTPFSMAWLGELIAEVIDVDPPTFPAESGVDSHLDGDIKRSPLVVSDALDAHGHSITVRNHEFKYVTRELTETADVDVVHTPPNGGFNILMDRGERELLDRESTPDALTETAASVASSPSELGRVEGKFSRTVERQLEQLGYKM
ncbi:sulfatase [Halobacteriales archaeon QS_4_69_225]|nr:MAG: sulfatase [Halobacteriales archaeon QS_4_69_225]